MFIRDVREELSVSNDNYLEQSNLMLDEKIIEINSLGNYINQMDNFNRNSVYRREDFSEYRDLINRHEHSTNAVDTLYIIFNNPSYVFSSRGNMTIDALIDYSVHFSTESQKNRMREVLEENTVSLNVINNRIFYTIPLGRPGQSYGSILAVINANNIRNNLELLSDNNEGMSFLVNADDDIVLTSSIYEKLDQQVINTSIDEILESDEIKIDGTNYLSNKVTNDLTGWTFVSLVDSRQFYRPLYNIFVVAIIGIIILTLIGVVVSYYFAKQNYRPVKNIIESFSRDGDQGTQPKDEWGYIETNISRKFSEVKDLSELVDEQAPIIRNALLLDLLDGNYSHFEKIEKRLEEIDIHFPYDYFSTIIVELGKKAMNTDYISAIERISHELDTTTTSNEFVIESTVPPLKNNQIVIIVNLKKDNPKIWKHIIQSITQHFSSNEITKETLIKMGVGSTHESWEKIKNAHIEASSALETINKKRVKENKVLFFKDINNERSPSVKMLEYPKEGTMLLLQSLKQGNQKMAEETIAELFNKIRSDYSNPIAIQVITAYVYNAVLEVGNELGITEYSSILLKLSHLNDSEQTEDTLKKISLLVCKEVNDQKEIETNEIGKNIVQYIFEEFSSPDISLEQIASEYNISISYASKLIKEETGDSFSNIIQSLRMNLFKELLLTTSTAIKDLVVEVGYYDVSNFTRKFRKENGMTPGQYRKKYKDTTFTSSTTP